MRTYYIMMAVKIAAAVVMAVIFGNGAVVWFNRMPVRWFSDPETGELPKALADMGDGSRQRIASTPWKYIFTAFLGAVGIFLALRESAGFEIAAVIVIFIVLEMAVSDSLYMIVPDQLCILLAVSAVGFITFYDRWWEQLAGAGIGLGLGIAVYALGRLIYKTETIGGADIKFYAASGLIFGMRGVVCIFVLTTIILAVWSAAAVISHRKGPKDRTAMMPCALAAVTVYLVFLWNLLPLLQF
jgi:leader peptidase (prepilin peptidase)/N-methyltransferase